MVSAETLIRIIILVIYVFVGLITFRLVLPHLTTLARRLAYLAFGVHVLAIAMYFLAQPSSSVDVWLWNLKWKFNIPGTFSSMQLALVGGVALTTAWRARTYPLAYRMYHFGICAFFLILARDEYFDLHENSPVYDMIYVGVGAAYVVATLILAARSPRRAWRWQACLLAGMALYLLAAEVLDNHFKICDRLLFIQIDGCMSLLILEEVLELLSVWLILVSMLGHFTLVTALQSTRIGRVFFAMPAIWFAVLILLNGIPSIAQQLGAQPADVAFDSGDYLHAYRIEKSGNTIHVHTYFTFRSWAYEGLGYSIHLVDQASGKSVLSRETYANRRMDFLLGPGHSPVFREWVSIEIASHLRRNRALWIVFTVWRERDGDYARQTIADSGRQLLGEDQIVLEEIVLRADRVTSAIPTYAQFEQGVALSEFDLPKRAQAGGALDVAFTWHSANSDVEDFVQFLHLKHMDTDFWWGHDQQPLGARLPTRLWYRGLLDSETWSVALPDDLAAGRYQAVTGLYRPSDLSRLQIIDADGSGMPADQVSLGEIIVERDKSS
ncbi:MAG: hypothetical protein F4X02_17250 [Chloroflexi bacterium]|nr:hypothetical protein [Chloroflexota bacterium]